MSAEKQKTILLVEDEAITAMAEKMTLEKFGYTVILANNGKEAVAAVEKTPTIDLILMDIDLGAGMDGTEAAEAVLRQHDLPVVFLSSHTEPEVVAKTEKITSYGYVVKNSNSTVLDASIKMAFKLFEAKVKEKEKEEALRKSEEQLRAIISNTPDHIINHDIDLRYLFVVNPQLGLTEADMLGKTDRDILEREEAEKLIAIKRKVIDTGEPYHLQTSLQNLKGENEYFEGSLIPKFDSDGKPDGLIGYFRNVTQRKRAEDALRESEVKFRAILDATPFPIALVDVQDDKIDFWSRSALTLFGHTAPTATEWYQVAYPDPDYRRDVVARWKPFLEKARKSGQAVNTGEYRVNCRDGSVRICELFATFLADHLIVTFNDITERKRAEEALHLSEAQQSNALQMTKSGHWEYDVDRDLFTFNDNFYRIFRTTAAAVGGYQLSSGDYARRFCHPDDMVLVGIETRAAIEATDLNYSRQIEHRILYADGEVGWIAVRFFISKDPQGRTITTYGVNQDISERKQVELALRENEKELQYLFKSMITAFVLFESIFDVKGDFISYRFVYINDAYERITGVKNEEVKGKSVHEVWPETEPEWVRRYGEVAITGVSSEFEMFHGPTKKLYHCNVYRPWDSKSRFCVIFEDITERKQAEQTLQESEARYQLLFEQSPDGIVIIDPVTMRILEFNETAHRQLGYSREEFARLSITDLEAIETPAETQSRIARVMHEGLNEFETRQRTRQGEIREIHVMAQFKEMRGRRIFFGIWRDITERKQEETALKENERAKSELLEKLNEAQHLALIGSWDWDLRSDRVWWSEETYRIFGVTSQDFVPSFEANGKFIHPEDFAWYKGSFEHSFQTGEPLDVDLRLISGDGKLKYCQAKGKIVYDDAGQALRFIGTLLDITERKQAEEEIKQQLAEKMILLKEVHHRIKNNIASIRGLISLQMQAVTNPQAIAILQDAIGRVDNMRLLYDKLLLTEGYQDISVKNYLDDLIDTIIVMFPGQAKITVEKSIADFHLDSKRLFPLGIIINELLTNIMKNAFNKRDSGLIKISLTNIDKHVTLSIQDNGVGLPDGFDIKESKGFGLMLVKMLSQQLGGSFSIEKHKGTKCTVEFNI